MREEVTKQDILRAINELIVRQRKFIEKIDATNAESKTDITKVEKT